MGGFTEIDSIFDTAAQPMQRLQQEDPSRIPVRQLPVTKSAPDGDMPRQWPSDGKVDRVGDLIAVDGIQLGEYRKNPLWHYQHDYDRPIGRSAVVGKVDGKLKSTLDLAVGLLPDADMVQKLLVSKIINACSIGFMPVVWSPMAKGDGIYFESVNLLEISAVTVPCCAGAICDGPVKALPDRDRARARRQRDLDLIQVRAGA